MTDRAVRILLSPQVRIGAFVLFFMATLYDPADTVLRIKVWLFALCGVLTVAYLGHSRASLRTVPKDAVVYVALFVGVPLLSLAWLALRPGVEHEGFTMIKGYVLIVLAPMALLNRLDLAFPLSVCTATVAVAICTLALALRLFPEHYTEIYNFGRYNGIYYLDFRAYNANLTMPQIYLTTSPMLVFPLGYFFYRMVSAPSIRPQLASALIVVLILFSMYVAGTRNNIFASIILFGVLLAASFRARLDRRLYWALWSFFVAYVAAIFMGHEVLAVIIGNKDLATAAGETALMSLLNTSEASNSTKIAYIWDYLRIFSEPMSVLFGQGLGVYEYWAARGRIHFTTELTYFEVFRYFGLFGGAIIMALLAYPIWLAIRSTSVRLRMLTFAYVMYLVMCFTNPNLISSMGITILAVLLASLWLERNTPADRKPEGVVVG